MKDPLPRDRTAGGPWSLALASLLLPALSLALLPALLPIAATALIPAPAALAVEAPPATDPALEILGAMVRRQSAEALAAGREAYEAEPTRLDLLHLVAGLFVRNERAAEGAAYFRARVDSTGAPGFLALAEGVLALGAKEPERALPLLEDAAAGFESRDDTLGLLIAGIERARALLALERAEEAAPLLEATAGLTPPPSLVRYRMMALEERAALARAEGDLDRSEALRREALGLDDGARSPHMRGLVLFRLARLCEERGDLLHAAELYQECARHAEALRYTAGLIDLNTRTAGVMFDLGRVDEARERLRASVERARAEGSSELQAEALYQLARAQRRLGEIEQALATCEEMQAHDGGAHPRTRARATLIRVEILQQMGRLSEALALLDELEPQAEELGGSWPLMAWNARANVLLEQGDIEAAAELYRRALETSERRGDRRRAALYLANLAGCRYRQGRYQEAMAGYGESLARFEELGLGFEIGRAHLNLANVELVLGDLEAAVAALERARATFRELESVDDVVSCDLTLASVQITRERWDEARALALAGLEQARERDDPGNELRALFLLGRIDLATERPEAAAASLSEVAERSAAGGLDLQASRALAALGEIESRAGRFDAARIHLEGAIAAAHRLDSPRFDVVPHLGMARLHRRRGEPEEALRHYRLAIENIERLRWGTGAEEERWFVFGENAAAYLEAAQVLLAQGAGEPSVLPEAFRLAEMGRARTFVDRLEALGVDVDAGIPDELKRARGELLQRLGYTRARLLSLRGEGGVEADAPSPERLEQQLEALDQQYERLEGRIRQQRSPLSELRSFEAAGLEETRGLLPPGGIFLECLLQEDEGWMLAVPASGEPVAWRLPEDLPERIREFRDLLEAGSRPRAFDLARYCALGHELYLDLVAPALERAGEPAEALVVAPDGPLWTVPLEALLTEPVDPPSADRLAELPYLFRRLTATTVPSATVWRRLIRRAEAHASPAPDPRPTLVLADPLYPRPGPGETRGLASSFPPLPHSGEEARRVVRALGEENVLLLTGAEATEERLKRAPLDGFRRLHLAAHARVDEDHPQRSAVVLSLDDDLAEDGFLTIREIYDLGLRAELVVLSACNTAAGRPIRGEGVIQLARPFLVAGASAALVTLWPIDDRSTVEFVGAFYRALAAGRPAEAALQQARAAMLASERPAWRLPYHWAAFVLVGAP